MGIDKIILRPEMVESFRILGFPKEFMVVVGFTELVLAMMLQAKYFTKLAIHGLIFILSVAILLHLINHQYMAIILPSTIIGMFLVTLRMGQIVRNLKWVQVPIIL